MKIEILNEVEVKGKGMNLFNYRYVASDGTPISAIFQATKQGIENLFRCNVKLSYFVDTL